MHLLDGEPSLEGGSLFRYWNRPQAKASALPLLTPVYSPRDYLSGTIPNYYMSHSAGGICITMRAVAGPEISPPDCLPIRYLCRFRPQNLRVYSIDKSRNS